MEEQRTPSRASLRRKIEEYFMSHDREMWKIGQMLCHQYRFDYYVAVTIWLIRGGKRRREPSLYSLFNIDTANYYKVHKIRISSSARWEKSFDDYASRKREANKRWNDDSEMDIRKRLFKTWRY